MAEFYKPGNPTNDPNYLGLSKEPDRIPADRSMEALFSGIGDTVGIGLKVYDDKLKRDVKVAAREELEPIRAAHGGEMDPSEVTAIAGMGAKGKARRAAMDTTNLFGSDDGGGAEADLDGGQGGDYHVAPKPLPPSAQVSVTGLRELSEAYLSGGLSDSRYYAELQKGVQRLKARFPGYEDEVDTAVSQITGVTPANALRRSLLSDLNANMSAMMAGQSQQSKLEFQYGAEIEAKFPGYFADKSANGGNSKKYAGVDVLAEAQTLRGEKYKVEAEAKRLDLDEKKAVGIGQDAATLVVSTATTGAVNGNGGINDLMKKIQTAGAAGISATDRQQLNAQWQMLDMNIDQAIRSRLNEITVHGGGTLAAKMGPDAVEKVVKNAKSSLASMKQALDNNELYKVTAIANSLKEAQTKNVANLYNAYPDLQLLHSSDQLFGGSGQILNNATLMGGSFLPTWQKAIRDGQAVGLMQGANITPSTAVAQLAGPRQPVSAKEVKATTEMFRQIVVDNTLDPTLAAPAAAKFFTDTGYFARIAEKDKVKMMHLMSSPTMTARISELAKSDPSGQLWNQYSSWVKYATRATFKTGLTDAQEVFLDKRATVTFNPETMRFVGEYKGTGAPGERGANNAVDQARIDNSLSTLNQVVQILKPVLDQNKEKGTVEMFNLLKQMGVDPEAPPKAGILKSLYDAVVKKLTPDDAIDLGSGITIPNQENPKQPEGGKLSLSDDPNAPLKKLIAGGESADNYNAVFGLGTANLSKLTVGELMTHQKIYTDGGAASSAAGKYQFVRKTLDSLVKDGVVSLDEKFTPEVQERLADALLERRGLRDYRAGKISKEKFVDNLAMEWAALQNSKGRGHYDNDGLNRASISVDKIFKALEG